MPDRRPRVVVMVKVPRAGRVKTRLGRDLGMTGAAWWFRHQVSRLLRNIRDPRWQTLLSVSPDREGAIFPGWPRDLARVPQGPGDLGARMSRIFQSSPAVPTLVIGGDIPGITRAVLADAFDGLRGADAVIGPATDGGYWLIGMRQPARLPRDALARIRWSGPYAHEDTIAGLGSLRVATAQMLSDVDTVGDLSTSKPA